MAETTHSRRGPVLVEVADAPAETPMTAAPVPDFAEGEAPEGRAMQRAAAVMVRAPSRLARFFWTTFGAFVSFWVSVAAWSFIEGLLTTHPVLGLAAAVVTGLFLLALLSIAVREWAGYSRLARLDRVHAAASAAVAGHDLKAARKVTADLMALYAGRAEMAWGRDRVAAQTDDTMDADTLLHLVEAELLGPLDKAARREIEASARQVATVTAIVPLALADVVAALTANLRMIRRIAEIYGGRAGVFGGWRLTRTVFTHLLATGAVAVGDDLIHSVAGGGLLSKVSRRFGEGVINGALTARVGVAAMEVCRPLPFGVLPRPRVSNLVSRGLAGLFGQPRTSPSEAGET